MIHLAVAMYCNWPTDHAIDHSSIGLKRLTIQLVFNEVSLFTFYKGTHGFDVRVPKNYLNPLATFPFFYNCISQQLTHIYALFAFTFPFI